jgi:hypothetical protein
MNKDYFNDSFSVSGRFHRAIPISFSFMRISKKLTKAGWILQNWFLGGRAMLL